MAEKLTDKCRGLFPLPKSAYQIRGGRRGLYFCDSNGDKGILTGENYKPCQEKDCFNLRYFELKDVPEGWEEDDV